LTDVTAREDLRKLHFQISTQFIFPDIVSSVLWNLIETLKVFWRKL